MKILFLVFILAVVTMYASTEQCSANQGYVTVENNSGKPAKAVITWKDSRDSVELTPGARSSAPVKKLTLQKIDMYTMDNGDETLLKSYTAAEDCDEVIHINISFSEKDQKIDCSRICYWTYSFPVHQKFGPCEQKCP